MSIDDPVGRKVNKEVLSREEIQRIGDAADSERDPLIVRVLADTGVGGKLIKLREADLVEQDRMHSELIANPDRGVIL